MTILFLTMNPFSRYPVYKRAVGLGDALARCGNRVYVVAKDCPENRSRLAVEASRCEPLWINRRSLLGEVVQKLLYIRRIRPDCIFSTSYAFRNLMGLSWLFPCQSKYVIEICELYSGLRRLGWLKEWFIAMEADGVLCASRYLEKAMAKHVRSLRLTTSLIYQPYACPAHLEIVPGLKQDAIVYMAYMNKGYGCYLVVKAFQLVHGRWPEITLEMLGSGPELEPLKRWVREHKCDSFIRIRGYVDEGDLSVYFSRALAFLSPMQNVRLDIARCPSKIFHYLPYGKPIVTCKIGNPYDVLGEYGIYYEPGNVESLARAIEEVIITEKTFRYPESFLTENRWPARACEFKKWLKGVK